MRRIINPGPTPRPSPVFPATATMSPAMKTAGQHPGRARLCNDTPASRSNSVDGTPARRSRADGLGTPYTVSEAIPRQPTGVRFMARPHRTVILEDVHGDQES